MNKEFKRQTFLKSPQHFILFVSCNIILIMIIQRFVALSISATHNNEMALNTLSSPINFWTFTLMTLLYGITLAVWMVHGIKKFRCYLTSDGMLQIKWNKGYYNNTEIHISQIQDLSLVPQKFIWGVYNNVKIIYIDRHGRTRKTRLLLQEPQLFIEEVEKLREHTKIKS